MSETTLSAIHLDTITEHAMLTIFIAISSLIVAVIVCQILTGKINLKGLLTDKSSGRFSPGRLQNLVLTFLVAAFYLEKLMQEPVPRALPDMPDWSLEIIFGSSALYLGGKSSPLLGRLISSLFSSKGP